MDSEKSIEKLKYKMTLLGDTAVGKTSLFKKLTKEEFDPKIVSTIGIDKKTLNFNINSSKGEKEVEISLYDTAGQEKFRSISISYFRDSKGLLVIYDISNFESFKNVEHWLVDIKDSVGNNDDYLIILIGNKLDLIKDDPQKRDVEEGEAKEFCTKNKILWGGECSAKDDSSEKLKEMFINYIEEMYKKVGANIKKNDESLLKNLNGKKKKGCC